MLKREDISGDEEEKFWKLVQKTNTCWLWLGFLDKDKYGRFNFKNKSVIAHRFSYILTGNIIPFNFVVDHICYNPSCVKPSHLQAITQQENLLRSETFQAKNAAKTHCPQGHEYTLDNTYTGSKNERQCYICRQMQAKIQNKKRLESKWQKKLARIAAGDYS